jgi:hypothetical protein
MKDFHHELRLRQRRTNPLRRNKSRKARPSRVNPGIPRKWRKPAAPFLLPKIGRTIWDSAHGTLGIASVKEIGSKTVCIRHHWLFRNYLPHRAGRLWLECMNCKCFRCETLTRPRHWARITARRMPRCRRIEYHVNIRSDKGIRDGNPARTLLSKSPPYAIFSASRMMYSGSTR